MASDSQGSAKSSVPGKVWNLVGQVRNEFPDELLRTPAASEAERGHQPEDKSRARGGQVTLSGQMMTYFPTPNTMDYLPARTAEQKEKNKGKGGYANVRETVVNDLIPTPTTRDHKDGSQPHERDGIVQTDTVARAVFNSGEVLLPTTRTSMKNGATAKEVAAGNPKFRLEAVTNWGKFEPAIKRWEETLGRPAPAPTKPDGKEGAHRLSSAFTEWMMGVPEGWITNCGLSRNDELKACGNGVVPQQAELALRVLLQGITLPEKWGQVNLPTPTVSDTFTDNLKSTQQKQGSMHSVTLPQAVRMVAVE
jgi:DNA (cytosine-5)-methyltransferase 1